jgi:hypothetical protein
LDNNLITGSDLLAFRRETDHSILGKGRDGEEDHGGEELHYEGCECVVYSRIKSWIVCFFVEYSEWIEKYGLDPGFLYSKKLHQHNLISPKFKILK